MLYNYFKDRFVRKLDELGRQRLEYEKEVLRNLSDGTLHRCKQEPVANFCQYFNKGEIKFLDELRENQRNKSLKLLKSRNDIKLKQNIIFPDLLHGPNKGTNAWLQEWVVAPIKLSHTARPS